MSDIVELESRISAALGRIRAGLAQVPVGTGSMAAPAPAAGTAELAALRARLEEERIANAQLEARVKALKDRQDERIAALEDAATQSKTQLALFDRDLQRLREANADLRDINGQLRDALAEGVADPGLINKAMRAELDALAALRAADAAEVDAVLEALRPILAEAT
ncbi:MAG: hypothetical protein GC146_14245 [Limimaricola sp.]|uniref:hypothetical protein n=1 Tax=Limimaricola sp. TaxID=2211665 RepID=UPI001D7A81DE|nr:hypothetical protein [Limimaricola sp.]MBI1418378.1 hypothetical protein [Limimaricola sp.]